MALAIIMIFLHLVLFVLTMRAMFSNLESKHGTKGTPPLPRQKTVSEILKEALASPPLGCMWEVKKSVKHYRKAPDGRMIFDGTVDTVFAEVELITPHNKYSFSIPVEDIDRFKATIEHNVQACLYRYKRDQDALDQRKKQIEDGWDGVYS